MLPAQAITFKDLHGKWTANHTETFDGENVSLKSAVVGTKRSDGGVVLKETVTSPIKIVATYTLSKDGKFKSVAVRNGTQVISSYSGTWTLSKGVIKISAKGGGEKFSATVTGNKNNFFVKGSFGSSKLSIKGKRK